ncbi:DNA polymerase III subunit alpha [Oceanobacillus jeddahense]|uniref:DNA polymerase III subunit alpha n=1 Tax=Oceanobacillus jeddahense TaxID=1462527 RepID=A0ABY5JRN2_9BACI|nr:DNA polymerase III subunit alpha [Oceanobacillus jeddahense]UUI01721.1 DNA polymerase III subunit alpha [Oceanobacillus jeddahense]
MTYTHISVKSGYSLMESTISIQKLVQKAKKFHAQSLCLTDEAVLYGAVSFYKACMDQGIKPIIGMTVPVQMEGNEQSYPFIVLAKNKNGYQQLLSLSTYLQTNHMDKLPIEQLTEYTEGIIGVASGKALLQDVNDTMETDNQLLVQQMKRVESYFQTGDFYVGIDPQLHQLQLWQEMDFTYVAMQDVLYLDEQDVFAYDCLQAMRYGKHWIPKQKEQLPTGHHFTSPEEMKQLFYAWPELLDKTEEITDKCTTYLHFDEQHLPSFPTPNQLSADAYLRECCEKGLKERYPTITETHRERLEYELKTIINMNYSDYFLIVADFIQFAKTNHIMVGPGRGSSAGSIVAYILGITEVDPLKYNLLFERFLNPERQTMPDIDVDFSDIRRDEVIDYVRDKYGKEHVAQIITFGTYATRSILRELMKTMNIHDQDVSYILREMKRASSKSIQRLLQDSAELATYVKSSEKLKTLFSIAMKLEGLPRNVSTHAAGVVISEQPLVTDVPLTSGTGETYLTQYAMNELEAAGLLKMDFLGLRNLSLIERVTKSVAYTHKKNDILTDIPEQDEKTFAMLRKGETSGVFQLESAGMQNVLKELQPSSFEDIVAVNALYRPGPMDFIPVYIRRKFKQEPVTYPHPDLEPILKSTYGVLIYQEQIMQIAHRIAGFSLGDADILRRAVSKKKKEVMQEQEQAFIKGCLKNGYSQAVAGEIFSWIVRFSNYGFPRSHAVAYSKISYQLSFLKAHYPEVFFSCLLTDAKNQPEKLLAYQESLKEINIDILPPHINRSYQQFTVEKKGIRAGLAAIKGISYQALLHVLEIRKEAPFAGFFDFCMRIDIKKVNRAAIKNLILAGSFDTFHSNRASLIESIAPALEQKELFQGMYEDASLFHDALEYTETADYSMMQKLHFEKELMGIYISNHPFESYRNVLRANGIVSFKQADQFTDKRKDIFTAGVVEEIKVIRTKNRERMAFLTVSDEDKKRDAVIFPDLFRQISNHLEEEQIVWMRVTVEKRNQKLQFVIKEIAAFDLSEVGFPETKKLFIRLTDQDKSSALKYLQQLADQHPGKTPVIVYNSVDKETYQLATNYSLQLSEKEMKQLKNYFGNDNVVER